MPALELDIQTIKSSNGLKFTIQIVHQRLRGSRAGFTASNGFYFVSLSCPAIGIGYNTDGCSHMDGMMYLRGSARNTDDYILETRSVGYIEKLKRAVMEYNVAKEDVT